MKIAYILYPNAVLSGKSNGIKSQAIIWKEGLEKLGNQVTLINLWENYDWHLFDVIHIFGKGLWLAEFVQFLEGQNANIFVSPIIDSSKPIMSYKASAWFGLAGLRLYTPTFALRCQMHYIKGVFVRSNHEKKYVTKALGVDEQKVHKIALPYSVNVEGEQLDTPKEPFCLHVSSVYQERKNVMRLIEAAKRYKFRLVLAGSTGSKKQHKTFMKVVEDCDNIEILGFVSNKQLVELYKRAQVFALPSILEGVGIVALDAAAYGCEIVITEIGGPKEYYNGLATVVNPFDVDEIGMAVKSLIKDKSHGNNVLSEFVLNNYSQEAICKELLEAYS